jgi:nucleotide-binding universal stress UspA family protein
MYSKVMLALDGSEEPSQLVSTATQLMDEEGGHMLVVHLTELIAGRGSGPVHLDENDRIARVREQVARLTGDDIDAKLVLGSTVRNPAEAIARVAELTEADVIVTGPSGHGPMLGAIAGDTPKALLRRAPCPVLVVAPRSRDRQHDRVAA